MLELTEYILLEDSERAMTVLADLKDLGIRLALDDFGTGFSSLSYLRRLPIDTSRSTKASSLKIGGGPTGRAIAAAVTNLAHILGLTVTAEGVETKGQRDEIRTMDVSSPKGSSMRGRCLRAPSVII